MLRYDQYLFCVILCDLLPCTTENADYYYLFKSAEPWHYVQLQIIKTIIGSIVWNTTQLKNHILSILSCYNILLWLSWV